MQSQWWTARLFVKLQRFRGVTTKKWRTLEKIFRSLEITASHGSSYYSRKVIQLNHPLVRKMKAVRLFTQRRQSDRYQLSTRGRNFLTETLYRFPFGHRKRGSLEQGIPPTVWLPLPMYRRTFSINHRNIFFVGRHILDEISCRPVVVGLTRFGII